MSGVYLLVALLPSSLNVWRKVEPSYGMCTCDTCLFLLEVPEVYCRI